MATASSIDAAIINKIFQHDHSGHGLESSQSRNFEDKYVPSTKNLQSLRSETLSSPSGSESVSVSSGSDENSVSSAGASFEEFEEEEEDPYPVLGRCVDSTCSWLERQDEVCSSVFQRMAGRGGAQTSLLKQSKRTVPFSSSLYKKNRQESAKRERYLDRFADKDESGCSFVAAQDTATSLSASNTVEQLRKIESEKTFESLKASNRLEDSDTMEALNTEQPPTTNPKQETRDAQKVQRGERGKRMKKLERKKKFFSAVSRGKHEVMSEERSVSSISRGPAPDLPDRRRINKPTQPKSSIPDNDSVVTIDLQDLSRLKGKGLPEEEFIDKAVSLSGAKPSIRHLQGSTHEDKSRSSMDLLHHSGRASSRPKPPRTNVLDLVLNNKGRSQSARRVRHGSHRPAPDDDSASVDFSLYQRRLGLQSQYSDASHSYSVASEDESRRRWQNGSRSRHSTEAIESLSEILNRHRSSPRGKGTKQSLGHKAQNAGKSPANHENSSSSSAKTKNDDQLFSEEEELADKSSSMADRGRSPKPVEKEGSGDDVTASPRQSSPARSVHSTASRYSVRRHRRSREPRPTRKIDTDNSVGSKKPETSNAENASKHILERKETSGSDVDQEKKDTANIAVQQEEGEALYDVFTEEKKDGFEDAVEDDKKASAKQGDDQNKDKDYDKDQEDKLETRDVPDAQVDTYHLQRRRVIEDQSRDSCRSKQDAAVDESSVRSLSQSKVSVAPKPRARDMVEAVNHEDLHEIMKQVREARKKRKAVMKRRALLSASKPSAAAKA